MATEQNAQARTNGADPLEKDYGNSNGSFNPHDSSMDSDAALKRIRTAGSISISPELFEKIYLSPQNAVKGDLRKTFGNPTPVALLGFLLALTPLSCDLMGWRGAGGNGAASIGAFYFFGGLLMIVGGFLEFILGNTFPFVVFISFGAFWLTFAATLQPFYYAYGSYAPVSTTSTATPEAAGLETTGFTASFAFFLLFMGLLCLIYLICSLRTNVVFVVIFFTLVLAFSCLAAAYFYEAEAYGYASSASGSSSSSAAASKRELALLAKAGRLAVAGGACAFVTSMAGWYIFFAIMLAALDFPFQIPVGDLSTMIKGYSDKSKEKQSMA